MIAATDYNAANQILRVVFRDKNSGADGQEWLYRGVPASVYEELVGASSIGSAFGRLIRGKYEQERM
jgi:hypothetical protein